MSSQDQLINFLKCDDDFINGIVENKLNIPSSEFKVILVLLAPAIKPNENYLGLVYRSKIEVQILETNEIKFLDVIIKVAQEAAMTLSDLNVYSREKIVYENILSKFEKILLDKLGENIRIGPKMLMFKFEPNPVVVLDDLKAEGYESVDRKECLSLELSKCVLSKFAKFHAAGAKLFQTEGMIHESLDRNSPNASKPDINSPLCRAFCRMHEEFIKALRSYGDCDAYADKVEKWDKELIATGYFYESKPMKCGLQVLNHGDVWTNNMMFKLDTNEVLLIDYQLCFWGSPAYDILAFLAASVHDDFKVKHFDDLVEFYWQEFSENLIKLEYSDHIPSLDDFKEDLTKKTFIFAAFVEYLFFIKSSVEFSLDMLMNSEDEEALHDVYYRLYHDDLFIKAVKIWLPFMNERGFLDILIPKNSGL